jgi:phosphoglycolate phosphatase-like HAD superfamily hydrolase
VRALVLDFDGVISDSAREAFALALHTHCELRPASPLREVLARLDPSRPEAEPLYATFLELMPLGNRAEDYEVALRAFEAGRPLADAAAYDAFKAEFAAEELRTFHRRFYAAREGFRRADREGWLRLLPAYPGFLAVLRRRGGEAELAIATSKDRHSVDELLRHYGVASLFGRGRVLDKEEGASKRAHLELLERSLGIPCPEMTFVDDKVSHLESAARLGVRCVLAAWGYNGERERERARELGFLVCGLDDVEERLFGG